MHSHILHCRRSRMFHGLHWVQGAAARAAVNVLRATASAGPVVVIIRDAMVGTNLLWHLFLRSPRSP
jgi:hypothetical protein